MGLYIWMALAGLIIGLLARFFYRRRSEVNNYPLFESKQFVSTAVYQHSFQSLLRYYESQKYPTYCGVASLVMILNCLVPEKEKPTLDFHPGQLFFSQDNIFNEAVLAKGICTKSIKRRGLTLQQLADIADCYPCHSELIFASQLSKEQLRAKFIDCLIDSDCFIIANYDRSVILQKGRGHFSPIGAYDSRRQLVLILETSRYRYGPQWVAVDAMCSAMCSLASNESESRGFLVLHQPVKESIHI